MVEAASEHGPLTVAIHQVCPYLNKDRYDERKILDPKVSLRRVMPTNRQPVM